MTQYELIRSGRRTVSLTVSRDLRVIVRAPLRCPKREIDLFVEKHTDWIAKQTEKIEKQNRQPQPPELSNEDIARLRSRARELLPGKVSHFAAIMGVEPAGITITSAAARWGSCSGKNRLCFPYRLMLLPEDLIDYIVVHELSHIRQKNHGKGFYAELERYMPDYRERERRLKLIKG